MSVYELTPQELYESYVEGDDFATLLDGGRTAIASRLMRDEQLSDRDAYYAADQIMIYAQERVDAETSTEANERRKP